MKAGTIMATLALIALALSGCGGGGSDGDVGGDSSSGGSQQEAVTLQGTVADGYLQNAVVFADCNGNRTHDAGETSTTSGSKGFYTLSGPGIDACVLVAEVIAGQTIDEDDPAQPVSQSYTLMTPAGRAAFISPISTLVQGKIDEGQSLEDSETAIGLALGIKGLYDDYIHSADSATHTIAQTLARTMSELNNAADNSNRGRKTVLKEIIAAASDDLEAIVSDPSAYIPPNYEVDSNWTPAVGDGSGGWADATSIASVLDYYAYPSGGVLGIEDSQGIRFGADGTVYFYSVNYNTDGSINSVGQILGQSRYVSTKIFGRPALKIDVSPVREVLTGIPDKDLFFALIDDYVRGGWFRGSFPAPAPSPSQGFAESMLSGKTIYFGADDGYSAKTFNADGTLTSSAYIETGEPVQSFHRTWEIADGALIFGDHSYVLQSADSEEQYWQVTTESDGWSYTERLFYNPQAGLEQAISYYHSLNTADPVANPESPEVDLSLAAKEPYTLGPLVSFQGGAYSHEWSLESAPENVSAESVLAVTNLNIGVRWIFQASVPGLYTLKRVSTDSLSKAMDESMLTIEVN